VKQSRLTDRPLEIGDVVKIIKPHFNYEYGVRLEIIHIWEKDKKIVAKIINERNSYYFLSYDSVAKIN